MKTNGIRVALALALAAVATSGAAVLATLRTTSPAYPNATRRVFEKPLFQVGKGDVVEIVRWSTPLTQVRSKTGRLGWIESAALDTLHIPAVLSISTQSTKSSVMTAKDDSAVAKRWMEAQKDAAPVAPVVEKPLDFHSDSTHITPRNQPDSASK